MQGGVRKRGKVWYYFFEVGKVDGKRKKVERKGGNTKKEAQDALREALNEFEKSGSVLNVSEISVSDYLDYWFNEYVKVNCKHNTQENYKSVIELHIKPLIGIYKLKALTPAALQELLNKKFNDGFSKKTLSIIKSVITGSLKHAVYPWGLIKESPAQYIRMPKYDETNTTKEDLKVITMDDFNNILSIVPEDHSFYIPLNLGFYTGMRVSEVTGLTWDCVDLKNYNIRVEKILINKDREWIFGTPKTRSSFRKIPIGETLVKILKQHKLRQEANQIKYGEYYTVSDFVCTKENGNNVTPASVKVSTRNVAQKLDLSFNFHSLRHTHATLLLEAGANIKDIQERLGHSRIAITMDTYSHVTDKMRSETVDIFETATRLHKKMPPTLPPT